MALGFDAYHSLTIKRTPCPCAIVFSNGEITAANNGMILQCIAGAFNFLGIQRIKLDGALIAVLLNEINADNAAASIMDEAFNESGFVHGLMVVGSRP